MDAHDVIAVSLTLTALCSFINYKVVKLPKAIGITLVALILTIIVNTISLFDQTVNYYANLLVDDIGFKENFLHGMLSFLLFASSLHINTVELSKHKLIITLFATISVIISTLVIGYSTYWITVLCGVHLPLYYCLLFGALISPTDAVAVISILQTFKVPRSLEMKVAGEALFNDGMGIALFFMASALAYGQEQSIDSMQALTYFLREGVGGVLLGVLLGVFARWVLRKVYDFELAIILTLSLVSGGYALATSAFNVSGPICMATTGIMVGAAFKCFDLSEHSMRKVEEFWDLLDAILNAVLFVMIGIEFIRIDIGMPVFIASIAIIIATIFARWISVAVPVICLAKLETFNSAVISIMTWGCMRGGISIALAMSLSGPYRDHILTITYFVVLFSILVQGLTMKPLIGSLKGLKTIID